MIELLSPAGSFAAFLAALHAGADAVYVGGNKFSARAYAANFSQEELVEALHIAHLHGKKIYLTLNILCKEREFSELYDFLEPLYHEGLDGVIVQDIGIIRYLRTSFPHLPIHASTQMSLTSSQGASFLKSIGATRIVTARECSLKEIQEIHETVPIEIESFIHGAMCYAYSGQCLFSSIVGGRSGNRGRCAQPCRLPYEVFHDDVRINKPSENYLLSMKDLCTISILPQLIQAGICSFKIEGRMKKPEYTAGVTAIYRKYIDLYLKVGAKKYFVDPADYRRLTELYQRCDSGTGYYLEHNGQSFITLTKPSYESKTDQLNVSPSLSIKLTATCHIHAGEPCALDVSYKKEQLDYHLIASGSLCEKAKKAPLSDDTIIKQLQKTGGSSFQFSNLIIDNDHDSFLPISEINQLRRKAFTQIESQILQDYYRDDECIPYQMQNNRSVHSNETSFSVLVETTEQFLKLKKIVTANNSLHIRIYIDIQLLNDLDLSIEELNEYNCFEDLFISLPYVFRIEDQCICENILKKINRNIFKGFLIRNYEEISFCKLLYKDKILCADFNLYTFNQQAILQLKESGVVETTIPLELNEHEIRERGTVQSELLVYGTIPMMISAQCIKKTMNQCYKGKKSNDIWFLKDRKQNNMKILESCTFCYNRIMNHVPISLFNEKESIQRLAPKRLRLQFTTESAAEMEQIIQMFLSHFFAEQMVTSPVLNYTKGHFKRGIE